MAERPLRNWMSDRRLRTAHDGRFAPGHPPTNKTFPFGTERVHATGETWVRTRKPNPWNGALSMMRPKRFLVWERERGPVPEGCALVFVVHPRELPAGDDGCRLDNLLLLTRAELVRANASGAWRDVPPVPALRRVAIDAARLHQRACEVA